MKLVLSICTYCLLTLNSLNAQSCDDKKFLIGKWVLDSDTIIKEEIDKDSIATIIRDSIISKSAYRTICNNSRIEYLITQNNSDTIKYAVVGLTDSTYTLITPLQGKVIFYRKVK